MKEIKKIFSDVTVEEEYPKTHMKENYVIRRK